MKKLTKLLATSLILFSLNAATAQCPSANSCTPGTATNVSDGYGGGIYKVIFNTINKSSTGASEGYRNNSCTDTTTIIIGQAYSVTVNNGTLINESVNIWIDLDDNGSFDASNELVFSSIAGKKVHTGTITIPNGTTLYSYLRMRVSSDLDIESAPTPCSTPIHGQVEDYGIRVKNNPNPPVANFSADNSTTCNGEVNFTDLSTNIPTQWSWDFGDENTSSLPNPSHTYSSPGIYTVQLIAINNNGRDTISKTNFINFLNQAPKDANCAPSSALSFCCNYGIYSVKLGDINKTSANANEGYMDFTCGMIDTIVEGLFYGLEVNTGSAPDQDFKIYLDLNNNGSFESNELIKFASKITTGTINISVSSNSVKDKPLRLRICADSEGSDFNACGGLESGQCEDYTIVVTENPEPPIVNFSVDAQEKCDSIFSFSADISNTYDSIVWQFGDGEISNEVNPIHIYKNSGDYDVTLIAINKYGTDSLTRTNYIQSKTPPKAACFVKSGFGGPGPGWQEIGISSVKLGSMYNNTSSSFGLDYKDFSCDKIASVNKNQTYKLTVSTGVDDYHEVKVYIDINNDGEFDENNEVVLHDINMISHEEFIDFSSFSDIVYETNLRMRIMAVATMNGETVTDACTDIFEGEIEDYSVIIRNNDGVIEAEQVQFEVYPNPTEGLVNIQLLDNSIYNIRVLNPMGQVLKTETVIGAKTLNLSDLNSGIYFINIFKDNVSSTKKLILK